MKQKPETGKPSETPFQRFERLARKVVTAPKVDKHHKPPKPKEHIA